MQIVRFIDWTPEQTPISPPNTSVVSGTMPPRIRTHNTRNTMQKNG